MKEFLRNNSIFIIVVLFAAILRFLYLNSNPPSLNWDEISHGYNAYSILKTGRDEWGNFMPSIFRAYGDYKLPVYIYLTSISELFLGVNEFAVRLPSVLAGIGIVVFTYLIVSEIFKEKKIALLSSFLVAVEPWTLFISRPAFEANLALFFFLAGAYFLVKSFVQEKKSLFLSAILFGLSVWTYNSFRIFTPLFIAAAVFLYRNALKEWVKQNQTTSKKVGFILLLFFVPMFYQLVTSSGGARYSKVAILDEGAINRINEQRNSLNYPAPIPRLLANKITYFAAGFGKNYLSYLNPKYLFFEGGSQYQFSVPNTGLLYVINLPFLLLGLYQLLKLKNKEGYLLLSWLLLSPVAGSLTREAPHVLRSTTMLPIPMILSSLGFIFVLNKIKKGYKHITVLVYIIAVLLSLENYLTNYFGDYKKYYSNAWQYGYKEVVEYIKQNQDGYAKIVMTKKYGEPHEFILFYLKYNPKSYLTDKNLNRFNQSGWWWVDGFDKYFFVNDWDVPKEGSKFIQESKKVIDCRQAKCLLITSPGNVPNNGKNSPSEWRKIRTINFLDGSVAFELYENY